MKLYVVHVSQALFILRYPQRVAVILKELLEWFALPEVVGPITIGLLASVAPFFHCLGPFEMFHDGKDQNGWRR